MNTATLQREIKPSARPIQPGYNSASAPNFPPTKPIQQFSQAGGPPTMPQNSIPPAQMPMNPPPMNPQMGQPSYGMNPPPMNPQMMGQPSMNPQMGQPPMNPQMNPQMMGQPPMNPQMGQPPMGMSQQYGYPPSAPNQFQYPPQQSMGQPPAGMGMSMPQAGAPNMMGYGAGTISLQKGGNMSLSKAAPGLTNAYIGLGWDVRQTPGAPFDLDASCFMLNAAGKVRQPQDFIFYNNLRSVDGSIVHQGDNLTGVGEGDDERVFVNLALVPPDVQKIVFVVSIYESLQRNQNFGMVQGAFIRVVNADNQVEIVRFDLSEEASLLNCMIFGELYRYNNEWKFRAVGQGFQGGLPQVGNLFGMSLA